MNNSEQIPDKIRRIAFALTRLWFFDPKAVGMHRFKESDYPMVAMNVAAHLKKGKAIDKIAIAFFRACVKHASIASDANQKDWSMSGIISDMNHYADRLPAQNFRRKKIKLEFLRKNKNGVGGGQPIVSDTLTDDQKKIVKEIKSLIPHLHGSDKTLAYTANRIIKKLLEQLPEGYEL